MLPWFLAIWSTSLINTWFPFSMPSIFPGVTSALVGGSSSPSAIVGTLNLLQLRSRLPNTWSPPSHSLGLLPPTPTLPTIPLPPTPPPSEPWKKGRHQSQSHTDLKARRKQKPYSSGQRCYPSSSIQRARMRAIEVFREMAEEVGVEVTESCFRRAVRT